MSDIVRHQKGRTALIAALAAGATNRDAAAAAGVTERTVARRLEEPAFCAAVSEARAALVDATLGLVVGAASRAIAKLDGLLEAESEAVQLGAARSLVEVALRLRDDVRLARLEERLSALEERSAPLAARRRWPA